MVLEIISRSISIVVLSLVLPNLFTFIVLYFKILKNGTENRSNLLLIHTPRYLSNGAASFRKKIKKSKSMFDELLNAMDMVGFLDEVMQSSEYSVSLRLWRNHP